MKSTYKLLNIYLDGQPLPARIPKIVDATEASKCFELEDEINVFDYPICRRKVSGMKLLSYQSELYMLNLVGVLPDCKELFVIFDYSSIAEVAHKLFIKRVLQATSLIMLKYPGVTITFVGDGKDRSILNCLYQS